ncbi:hypothetical protein ACO1O0_001626 [Amphichorda felina]
MDTQSPSHVGIPSPSHDSHSIILTESQLSGLAVPKSSNDASTNRHLRVFMPADGPNINLCKTVMSSVALGYPLPTLLNWDGDFNRPEWHFGGSHIAKLESLLAVIEELLDNSQDAHEDDLALMVDAYDIWFQLPPSVLIQRYHQLNREADERNQRLWEDAMRRHADQEESESLKDRPVFPIPPPRQSIVVTAAKDCHPDSNSGSNPHYELWPPSPMPTDLYGDTTDVPTPSLFDTSRTHSRIRPRCLNSGLIIGTMGSLRDALRRAEEKIQVAARAGRQLWSDQALLAEVIGDQHAWRLWAQGLAATWNGTASVSRVSTLHEHVRMVGAAAVEEGTRFEFGIGVDYNFTMIPPTCSSEEDGYFAQINNKVDLMLQSEKAGVSGEVRVKDIPPELENAEDVKGGPWDEIHWGYEDLYSDFFFGVTPVGIHHNAYRNGLKAWRLKHWWPRMWFYSRLRDLVTYSLRLRNKWERVLVSLPQGDGEAIVYKAPKEESTTIFNPRREGSPAGFEELGWDAVCQKGSTPWYDELFGDNEGPLEV